VAATRPVPRLEQLTIRNYRALHDLRLTKLAPLTVFLGANGSGKSTLFDVFAFLSECFRDGVRRAWDKRGRFRELCTRGSSGPVRFTLKYREDSGEPLTTYDLAVGETPSGPVVDAESLAWTRGQGGRPFKFLDFRNGKGYVISGEKPDESADRVEEELDSPELLATATLGQLARHPRVSALRRFISSWYLSYLSADNTRIVPEAGPQERLSTTGDNLANVIQYLKERHPERLREILSILSRRVPRLESVQADTMRDGRLLLQIKDAPFDEPILAKYASDGTLKMLAYLTLLYDPNPPQLIGIEEPENQLHPGLLGELVEEFRQASSVAQVMVTTHSPYLVDGLGPEELWILFRDAAGYTQAKHVAEMADVKALVKAGGELGALWMEGYLGEGDPLRDARVASMLARSPDAH
jgi:predicted ATPase